ncbi:hypothetical protein pEaSNUABM11_00233 [Erwinia phage pEa_SNUABM_11]|nr:hypothetical protein pEaSNUABM11_00233 [Erwinia phage pEa_SNUABM_11]
MKPYCLALALFFLTGCGLDGTKGTMPAPQRGWPARQMDSPPFAAKYPLGNDDQKAFETYVIDVNVYAYYVYTYARSLNEYVKARGWHPPKVAPLCEEFETPDLHPIPERITLDRNSRTPEQISQDLANQFRQILDNYRTDRKAFRHNFAEHEKTCLN